ncbi:conjugal transfer protein [Nonomuraea sp. NPDC050328]|uniref:conjugal transfer protein n=1 Tax=Nonomuraea sp. NPDC050328 TaxID=3364361 RepID=UPI0037A46E7F
MIAGDLELSARPESTSNFEGRRSARRGWSGGGGRWLVATGRVIVWALILVVLANGVIAIVSRVREGAVTTPGGATSSAAPFPTAAASAFVVQFAHLYLDLNPAELSIRAARLKPYLPPDAGEQFGWDGYGRLQAAYIQPYSVEVNPGDNENAVVTLTFQSGDRRYLLSVPVHWDGGGKFVVSGRPGVLPAPGPAELPQVAAAATDDETATELRSQLAEFFRAYASGDQLSRYTASGTSLTSLGGAFSFVELKDIVVPVGDTTSREIQAVVVWGVPSGAAPTAEPTPSDPGAMAGRLEQGYRLTVVKQGDKWYVKDIRGAGRAVG